MRVILVVEPDQDERELLLYECEGVGLVIAVDDPDQACDMIKSLRFDIVVVSQARLVESSFGMVFSSLRLNAPGTRLLTFPLPSCPP